MRIIVHFHFDLSLIKFTSSTTRPHQFLLLTSITVTTSLRGFFFLGIFKADSLIPNLLCIGDRNQRKNVHGTTHEIQRPIRTDNKRYKKTHSLINDYLLAA